MTLDWMKPWILVFLVLSGSVGFNIMFMQPPGEQTLARARQAAPETRVSSWDSQQPNSHAPAASPRLGPGNMRTVAAAGPPSTEGVELTRAIQRELGSRGYETGGTDGMPGLLTRAAIMAYQHDNKLPLTGEASEELLQAIIFGREGAKETVTDGGRTTGQAERIVRNVQEQLNALGYNAGPANGRLTEDTMRAIRAFETAQSLQVTGRVSGPLVARLGRMPGRLAAGQ